MEKTDKSNLIFDTNILIYYLENNKNELITKKIKDFLQFGGSHHNIIFAGETMIKELSFVKQNTSLLDLLIFFTSYENSPKIDIKDDVKINLEIEKFAIKEKLNKRGQDSGIIYISYKYYVKIIFSDDRKLKKKITSNCFSYLNQN